MRKKSKFLPDSVSVFLRNIASRAVGLILCVLSLWFIIDLFFMDQYLTGFGVESSFGNQGLVANVVMFIKYGIGFIPSLFLFACLGRFGLSLFSAWDEERAPEYNLLRGFVTLCIGCAGFGLLSASNVYGGLAGAIVMSDFGGMLGIGAFFVGVLLSLVFFFMAGILLHIKWEHVKMFIKTVRKMIRTILSAFHLIAPLDKDEDPYRRGENR